MTSLAELQKSIQAGLLDPSHDPGSLVVGDHVVRAKRLSIYADACRARFVEALSTDFGALRNYLGDIEFDRLVSAYLEIYPSRYFSLRYLGENLSDFLREYSPWSQHSELCELACFEWALCAAFDAADSALIAMTDMIGIAPEQWPVMRFDFHASVRSIPLCGNIPVLWSALNAKQAPPALQLLTESVSWLVWRQDLKLMFRPLDEPEAAMMEVLHGGGSFGQACERLADQMEEADVPLRAVGYLQRWLHDGLLARVRIERE